MDVSAASCFRGGSPRGTGPVPEQPTDRRPLGWAAVAELPVSGTLSEATLTPIGHTFSLVGDSVRAALDAALLSPSGLAVGVDGEGSVVGVADAYELSAAAAGNAEACDKAAGDKTAGDDVAAGKVTAGEVTAGEPAGDTGGAAVHEAGAGSAAGGER